MSENRGATEVPNTREKVKEKELKQKTNNLTELRHTDFFSHLRDRGCSAKPVFLRMRRGGEGHLKKTMTLQRPEGPKKPGGDDSEQKVQTQVQQADNTWHMKYYYNPPRSFLETYLFLLESLIHRQEGTQRGRSSICWLFPSGCNSQS